MIIAKRPGSCELAEAGRRHCVAAGRMARQTTQPGGEPAGTQMRWDLHPGPSIREADVTTPLAPMENGACRPESSPVGILLANSTYEGPMLPSRFLPLPSQPTFLASSLPPLQRRASSSMVFGLRRPTPQKSRQFAKNRGNSRNSPKITKTNGNSQVSPRFQNPRCGGRVVVRCGQVW